MAENLRVPMFLHPLRHTIILLFLHRRVFTPLAVILGSFHNQNALALQASGLGSPLDSNVDPTANAAATIAAAALVSRQQQHQQQQHYQNLSQTLMNSGSAFVSLACASLIPYPNSPHFPIPVNNFLGQHSSTNAMTLNTPGLNQSAYLSPAQLEYHSQMQSKDAHDGRKAINSTLVNSLPASSSPLINQNSADDPHNSHNSQSQQHHQHRRTQSAFFDRAELRHLPSTVPTDSPYLDETGLSTAAYSPEVLLNYKYLSPFLVPAFATQSAHGNPQTTAALLPPPGLTPAFTLPTNGSVYSPLELGQPNGLMSPVSALVTATNYLPTSLSAPMTMTTPGGLPSLMPNLTFNLLKTLQPPPQPHTQSAHPHQSGPASAQPPTSHLHLSALNAQLQLQGWPNPGPYPLVAVGSKVFPTPGNSSVSGTPNKLVSLTNETGGYPSSDTASTPVWLSPPKIPRPPTPHTQPTKPPIWSSPARFVRLIGC
ncbi:unnamed protein product [Echinostoma caproni]|uniref:Proline-rich protein 36-like n=1 Tax=Echinostoma caproni TaxID=27848 RepID=A0A183AFX1_9TREM|nr:unnamed protein product [Echinostoma caproni]